MALGTQFRVKATSEKNPKNLLRPRYLNDHLRSIWTVFRKAKDQTDSDG